MWPAVRGCDKGNEDRGTSLSKCKVVGKLVGREGARVFHSLLTTAAKAFGRNNWK